jgi:L-serine dehydratase
MGESPDEVEVRQIDKNLKKIREQNKIPLLGDVEKPFIEREQLIMNKTKRLKYHSNGMKFTALNNNFEPMYSEVWYSIGGGFVISEEEAKGSKIPQEKIKIPYPYSTGAQLMEHCLHNKMTIPELVMENEKAWRPEAETVKNFLKVWSVMQQCVIEGCTTDGHLPGPLKLSRRAPKLYQKLHSKLNPFPMEMEAMDWVNLYSLAVSEQNAAGGRVVSAPTNGSCGIIPAVMHYYDKFLSQKYPGKIIDFMCAAGAIGILFKYGATLSGAEGGCQGEIGTASAMAAAGLTAALGGSIRQVENAAEIAIEHHLGLTCDPVAGLVQIPCIERNTMGSLKAINAAKLALHDDEGTSKVSLDRAIKVMKVTGEDMKTKYKETAKGGLAAEFEKDFIELQKKEKGDKAGNKEKEFKTSLGYTFC